MDGAQLVQRERLIPPVSLMPGQVKRVVRVLPGLLAAPCQTTDLAEPCDRLGALPRTRADSYADPLLQQRTPLHEAPLERRGIARARHDLSQPVPPVAGS